MSTIRVLLAGLTALLFILTLPRPAHAADDSAQIYKVRCAACHGVDGYADTPMARKQNIHSFASAAVQKKSTDELADCILNGGKERRASHTFATKGLSVEQGASLAAYVRQLGRHK